MFIIHHLLFRTYFGDYYVSKGLYNLWLLLIDIE